MKDELKRVKEVKVTAGDPKAKEAAKEQELSKEAAKDQVARKVEAEKRAAHERE